MWKNETREDGWAAMIASFTIITLTCTQWSAAQCQTEKLLAGAGNPSDGFGFACNLDGDTAIVGDPFADPATVANAGVAYIYVRDGGMWTQQAMLTPDVPEAGSIFGLSVAVDGDTAVVGAAFDDNGGMERGAAFVFTRTGSTWTQQAELQPNVPLDNSDFFGRSVCISGNTIVVGAQKDEDDTMNPDGDTGAVHVFTFNGSRWSQQAKLVALDAANGDDFGWSCDLEGDSLVVGAVLDETGTDTTGSAYAFVRNSGIWTQQDKLVPGDGEDNDRFGVSVSISSDTIFVGSQDTDVLDGNTPVSNAGAAYVFTNNAGVWTLQQKIAADNPEIGDNFGQSVSVQGDRAIITNRSDDSDGNNSGSVYLFTRAGSTWTQHVKLSPDDASIGNHFGTSASLDNDHVLIGALNGDGDNQNDIGAAYIFGGVGGVDCDENNMLDACEIEDDPSLDADNNGVLDSCESADSDGDGVPDGRDVCPGGDDTVDSDNDSIPDDCDNCPDTPNMMQADADSDSFGAACDCNDANPNVNPDAMEVCDFIDNNCDGFTDEGFDADNDGFTTCAGDCDDNNPDIFPGNTEVCDGQDNNCDGATDEGFDSDNDGTADCFDGCPNNPDLTAPGPCGCDSTDSDNDGALDCVDGCPNDPMKTAPGQCGCNNPDVDSDADGVADCVDLCPGGDDTADGDSDTIPDDCDNCPDTANTDQADDDNDTVGNACDVCPGGDDTVDSDNDGIPDDCDDEMPIMLDIEYPAVDDPDTTGDMATRCLRIVLIDCMTDDSMAVDMDVTFTDGLAMSVDIGIECGDSTEVCVKDQRHTLWASSPLADDGSSCFNDLLLSLDSGDTDNDSDVDIHDVTLVIAQFGGPEPGAMCPPALDGDGEPVNRGADFDGDGNVGTEDYSLLSENWLTETFCECPVMAMGGRPNVAGFETAAPASRFPAEIAAKADLNRDNVIDHRDVAIFERINQLPDALSRAIRRSREQER